MIKFSLDARAHGPWHHAADGRWRAGNDWVEPYSHPMVEHALLTDGASVCMIVRERGSDRSSSWWRSDGSTIELPAREYRAAIEDIAAWPLDYTMVKLTPGHPVVVSAGMWGTAPLYLTADSGVLHGSWDLNDLRAHIDPNALVDRVVARTLTYWRRYSADTVYQGVRLLTERASATFDGATLRTHYPDPAVHANPRTLRVDADIVAGFEAMLNYVISKRAYAPDAAAVELSGGMDSANVAMTLAAKHPGQVTAGAMVIGGPAGEQQTRRRREMIGDRFARDLTIPGMDFPPLAPPSPVLTGATVLPDEDPYGDAVSELIDAFPAAGVRTIFGGVGGDELVSLRENEREQSLEAQWWTTPDWVTPRTVEALHAGEDDLAPASPISEVTLMALASSNHLYLRRGCWPVSPLADPELIRFGEWLPTSWRRGKRLLRERLHRLGFTPEVVRPPLRKNLAGMMALGLRRNGIPLLRKMLAGGCALVDLGYVDGQRLSEICARADSIPDEGLDARLYPVIALEQILRGLPAA